MNSSANHQLRTPALAALAIATCVHGAFAQSPRFRALAASGDTATGVTGTAWYRAFTSGFVNEAGTTAFAADIDGIALPDEVTGGVWLGEVESFDQVGLFGVRSFASGVTIRSISNILGINADRDVFVSAEATLHQTGHSVIRWALNQVSLLTHPDRDFFLQDPSGVYRWGAFRQGGVAAGATFIASATNLLTGDDVQVFVAGRNRYFHPVILAGGRPAPIAPAGWTVGQISASVVRENNEFAVAIVAQTGGPRSYAVVYRGSGDELRSVVARGDIPVDIDGRTINLASVSSLGLNELGGTAYLGNFVEPGSFDVSSALVVHGSDGSVDRIVSVPLHFWDGLTLRWAFTASEIDHLDSSDTIAAVFLDEPAINPQRGLLRIGDDVAGIAAERGSAPDNPLATITRLQTAAAAPNGDIAWTGAISTPNLGIGEALYLAPADGSPQRRLLASGDPVPGPNGITRPAFTIRLLGNAGPDRLIARGGLTTSGFALVRVGFADGTQSLLLVDTLCPADVDRSRTVDLADLFAFFDAYDRRDWPADITADGSIDLADFFAFFEGFDTGCE